MSNYPIIWERKLGPLSAINRGYGIDYYWRGRWILTSAPHYVILPWWGKTNEEQHKQCVALNITYGILTNSKRALKFPKWWRSLWIRE